MLVWTILRQMIVRPTALHVPEIGRKATEVLCNERVEMTASPLACLNEQ